MAQDKIQKTFRFFILSFLFLLPLQTIWITQEVLINGVKWQYATVGFYGTEILLWISIFLFIIYYIKQVRGRMKDGQHTFRVTKDRVFVMSAFSFIVYVLLSTMWSIHSSIAFQHALYIIEAFLLFFMLLFGPLKFTVAARAFVFGATLASVLGIWQFFTQSTFGSKWLGLVYHPVWEAGTSIISGPTIGRWLRTYGPFSHPNAFGGYLTIAIIFTLLLLKHSRVQKSRARYMALYAACIIQLMALFFTFSRSAWIATMLVFLFYFVVTLIKKKVTVHFISFIVSICVFTVLLTAMHFPLVQVRFVGSTVNEIQSTTERATQYREAWHLFKQQPWQGVGVGNYTAALYAQDSTRPGWEYQPVHNVFLLTLVELGLVGIILLFFAIITFIMFRSSMMSVCKHKDCHCLSSFSVFYVLLFCFLLIFDHYLFSSYVGLLTSATYFGLLFRLTSGESV